MKSNEELQADVQNSIRWEPLLQAAETETVAADKMTEKEEHAFVRDYFAKR